MPRKFDTAVIGAGVFGAWIAWHLQRAGQRVLLVDQYGAANARASSGSESRVIRMAYGPDAVYSRMSWQSLAQWKDLFARVGQPSLFRATGVLWLADAEDDAAAMSLAVLGTEKIPHAVLGGPELAKRFPQMAFLPGQWGLFEPDSGALLARRAVQAVVADAVASGVELRIDKVLPPTGATHLAAVHTTSGELVSAARFVFACGPWLGRVLPKVLGDRIFPTRQEVFYFGTPAGDARFLPAALPTWLDMGRAYYGMPDLDGRGFKLAHDAHGEPVDPDTLERTPTPSRIERARTFLARRFPSLADAPLVGAEVCQYENTSNGDLVLDRHPTIDNAWIAGGGSGHGFKHGPAVGAYVAARMLKDGPVEPRFSLASKANVQKREVR